MTYRPLAKIRYSRRRLEMYGEMLNKEVIARAGSAVSMEEKSATE
jgi:hypothetical protein